MMASRRFVSIVAATLSASCAVNPATGKRELMLVGEDQEVAMGRQADQEVAGSLGVYPDTALQSYVADVGRRLAAGSERPELPWTFRVVDDPAVNAFALPGGFIYITRGLLAHVSSEAELAGVLGHEIGHVTARHSASQISRNQLASLGLGLGMALEPRLRRFGDLAGSGVGLLFLRFSRDDEREADDLGLRYLGKEGYRGGAMVDVFETLERASRGGATDRLPDWLSTHPSPESRAGRIAEQVGAGSAGGTKEEHRRYLARIDGLVYGDDPRNGFFKGGTFVHPGLDFEVDLPRGWEYKNGPKSMTAVAPSGDAAFVLGLSGASSATQAAQRFLASSGVNGEPSRSGANDVSVRFRAVSDGGQYAGEARFLAHRGNVLELIAYGTADGWERQARAVLGSLTSLRRASSSAAPPQKLQIVELPQATTLTAFLQRYPSDAPAEAVARVNGVEPGQSLPAGAAKRILRK